MNKQDRLYYLKRVSDNWKYDSPNGIEDKISYISEICSVLLYDKIAELEEEHGKN